MDIIGVQTGADRGYQLYITQKGTETVEHVRRKVPSSSDL